MLLEVLASFTDLSSKEQITSAMRSLHQFKCN